MCVLADRAVQHQHAIVRRRLVLLADHPDHLGQLFHQLGPILQPACRVDQQHVGAGGFRLVDGVEGEGGRVGSLRFGNDRGAGALAPDLELLDGGGPEGVAGGHHHREAALLELLGQLADGGGLAAAIDPDHQHDMRFPAGGDIQRPCRRAEDFRDILREGGPDFLVRHVLAELFLREIGDQPGRRLDAEIGGDQDVFQLFQAGLVQPFCGEDAGNAADQF